MTNAHGLTDREAAIDSVVRFVESLDQGDSELCVSALTSDVVFDLTPFQKVGLNYSEITGRDTIVQMNMRAVGTTLDTTHMITNVRCSVSGDIADYTCYVLAQHFRKGEGPSPEFQDHYLFGNYYKAEIVRDGDLWKVKRLTITPMWTVGKPEVMKV